MKLYFRLIAVPVMMTCHAGGMPRPEAVECGMASGVSPVEREAVTRFDARLKSYIKAIKDLKPGSTRGDVLKLFQSQGGLSTVNRESFAFRQCSLIKVDVVFESVDPDDSSRDVVKTISDPYLGYDIMD